MTTPETYTSVNGIEIPSTVAIIRGYLRDQLATVLKTQPIKIGGYKWTKELGGGRVQCGPWGPLDGVILTVKTETGVIQTYPVSRNDDGLVSEFLFGPRLA